MSSDKMAAASLLYPVFYVLRFEKARTGEGEGLRTEPRDQITTTCSLARRSFLSLQATAPTPQSHS
jgi:hypothetical protein